MGASYPGVHPKKENYMELIKKKSIWMIIAVALTSAGLRSCITGVGSMATMISESLSLNAALTGLITTLPLLAYAAASLFTGKMAVKVGAAKTVYIALAVIAAGLAVRSFLGASGLFIGTFLVGLGTGMHNVLLPAIIKAYFPTKIGFVTGLYSMFMAGFASLGGGISVPIALKTDWKFSLFIWIFLVAITALAWIPNRGAVLTDEPKKKRKKSVFRFPITWWTTLFMGFASVLFYAFVAWFATILQSKGYTQTAAGYYNSLMMLCGLPFALVMPILAHKSKYKSFWGMLIGLFYVFGMFGAIYAEKPLFLWMSIIGAGVASGGSIAYAMALIGLHTRNAEDATALSGIVQGIGYLLTACAPYLIGKLFDAVQNWTVPLIVLTAIGLLMMVTGWLSGLDLYVEPDEE